MRKLTCLLALSLMIYVNIPFADEKGAETPPDQAVSGTGKVLNIAHRYVNTGKYKEPRKGDPVAMAYEFLELNQDAFQITNPRQELLYKRTVESKLTGTKRVDFEQVYQGVRVLFGGFKVILNRNGEIEGIGAKYYYDIDLSTTPQIDSATVVKIALEEMGSPPRPKIVGRSQPFIVPSKIFNPNQADRFYLIWIVEIFPDSTKHLDEFDRFYVDALTGSIIFRDQGSILIR